MSIESKPIIILSLKLEDEYRLFSVEPKPNENMEHWLQKFPQAWAKTGEMGLAKQILPQVIELKASKVPVALRQYPMSQKDRDGIRPHIQRLIQQGILIPMKSPWNIPLLPVRSRE